MHTYVPTPPYHIVWITVYNACRPLHFLIRSNAETSAIDRERLAFLKLEKFESWMTWTNCLRSLGCSGMQEARTCSALTGNFFFFLYHRAFSKVNSLPQFLIYLKWEKSKFCMTTNSILVVTFQLCQIKCIFKYTEPNILWENKTWISKTEILNNVQEQPSFTLLLLVTKILNLENVPETQWMIGV